MFNFLKGLYVSHRTLYKKRIVNDFEVQNYYHLNSQMEQKLDIIDKDGNVINVDHMGRLIIQNDEKDIEDITNLMRVYDKN